jgi:hypothetical protein
MLSGCCALLVCKVGHGLLPALPHLIWLTLRVDFNVFRLCTICAAAAVCVVLQVIPQPQPVHDGAADQFMFLFVEPLPSSSSNAEQQPLPKVHLLPDSPSAQQQLAKSSGSLFFWLLQQGSDAGLAADGPSQTVLRGYGFEAGAAQVGGSGLPVVPAWQVVLPGRLLGLAAKDATEPVHSYVKVRCWCCCLARLRVLACVRTRLHVCRCKRIASLDFPACTWLW